MCTGASWSVPGTGTSELFELIEIEIEIEIEIKLLTDVSQEEVVSVINQATEKLYNTIY